MNGARGQASAQATSAGSRLARAWLAACCLATVGGCIDDTRATRDVEGDTPAGASCDDDGDCTRFANACNISACVERACVSEPVVCNDDNACTSDRCDEGSGCLFEPRVPGSACTIDQSEVCVGSSWHRLDACDDSGHCVDGGSEDCLPGGGTGVACQHNECVSGVGCALVADAEGTSCGIGGRSDVCIDAVRYGADTCAGGQCVDGGGTPCPTGFCQAAGCDGKACALEDIGVDIDVTGGWNLLGLVDEGGIGAMRIGVELAADGSLAVLGQLGPGDVVAPTGGSYCITTDGSLQLGLRYPNDRSLVLAGRLTRGRDLAVLTPEGGGIVVMVKDRATSEAKLLGGSYRIVGLDNAVVDGVARIEALLGTIAFADGCVTGGAYGLGSQPASVPLVVPNPPSCVEFGGLNAISFDVRTASDVRVWAGVVGTGGNYAVMQRYRVGERVVEPSLAMLVRIGLAQPFALAGDYALARVQIGDDHATLTRSVISFDGLGRITGFSEGDVTLGPTDLGTVTVSTVEPISGLLTTLRIGSETRQRVGQLGQTTSGKVDWFVDVATLPDVGGINGPVVGRTLQIGVRQP